MPPVEQCVIDRTNIEPQLDAFFGGLPSPELDRVDTLVDELRSNGNALFNTHLPVGTIEHVPMLLDDEDASTLHSRIVVQYTSSSRRPAIIVAGNTGETPANPELLELNLKAIHELGQVCTALGLPFSHYQTTYPSKTPIGRVRADKHAVGLRYVAQQARNHRVPPQDILLLSSDADVWSAEADTVPLAEAKWQGQDRPGWLGAPQLWHDRLDDNRFPRINRLLDWHDVTNNWHPGIAPTYYAVNAGAYAAAGGMQPEWAFAEINQLSKAMEGVLGVDGIRQGVLAGMVFTSARRLVSTIVGDGEVVEYSELRTPDPQASVSYRRSGEPTSDISAERFQELLGQTVRQLLPRLYVCSIDLLVAAGKSPDKAPGLARDIICYRFARALIAIGEEDGANDVISQEFLAMPEHLNRSAGNGSS